MRDDEPLPPRMTIIFYNGKFLSNFNASLLVILLPFVVGIVILIVGCIRGNK